MEQLFLWKSWNLAAPADAVRNVDETTGSSDDGQVCGPSTKTSSQSLPAAFVESIRRCATNIRISSAYFRAALVKALVLYT